MLKTDYKDAMYDGLRRWQQEPNEDGTVTMIDKTPYTQKGDRFGGNDINATNTEVNRMQAVITVALKASVWTGSAAPYVQTVNAPGITATTNA